ncbi:unnamed protein product [Allacma fusca]|uniref:DUF4806 domain-containing protein n=1 Tax=Allacma fusca TaxID=39272 RepID=A0A8J2J7S6_9HEXA|nr:unnamed protein product [Allacma fusca]
MNSKIKETSNSKRFAVIVFDEGNSATVVPLSWVTEDKHHCYWPDVSGPVLASLMANPKSTPNKSTWVLHEARILGKYKTLKLAREAEFTSLMTSGIESDSDGSTEIPRLRSARIRQHIRVDRHSDEDESFEDTVNTDLPLPSTTLFQFNDINKVATGAPGATNDQPEQCSNNSVPLQFQVANNPVAENSEQILDLEISTADLGNYSAVGPGSIHFYVTDSNKATVCVETQTDYHRGCDSKFQEIVLKKLAKLQFVQDRILAAVSSRSDFDADNFAVPNPCETIDEIELLEETLSDEDHRIKLASLRLLYSGKGKVDNSFQKLPLIHAVVIRSTRHNNVCKYASETDINKAIMEWLRLAGDRNSKRSHKKKGNSSSV